MSLFISFEGGEGCGKTTQAKILWRRLRQVAIPVILTHEPGGTSLGREIRHCLKKSRTNNPPLALAELLLFAASRAQLMTEVIRPNLEQRWIVLCDRFTDSTLAYQGYGRGINRETINTLNELATGKLNPDLVVLLDIPPEIGLNRRHAKTRDRFEQEDLAFHQRVREGYIELASQEPQRWLVINATLPKAEISQIIWEKVNKLLSIKGST